jgi:TrmH family RNA methyltransferase
VLLEGRRLIETAAAAGIPYELFTTDEADPLGGAARRTFLVTSDILEVIATTVHPQDAVAVAAWQPLLELPASVHRVLILSGMSDPGNVGTIIRTAAALGADAVVSVESSCDVTNPKVLRASAGTVFSIPVVVVPKADALQTHLRGTGTAQVGAVSRGGLAPARVKEACPDAFALWLGSESHGLDAQILDGLDLVVTIPMIETVESLNAAAAAAILLYTLIT